MTCFNRRESTLRCLESVYSQAQSQPRTFKVFLTDDLSQDGTVGAVRGRYPNVAISFGDGNLFWNRGMNVAFAEAMKEDFDYYLWLNDDTLLFANAFDVLLETTHDLEGRDIVSIVTGSTCDAASGKRTYGGIKQEGLFRRSLVPVHPAEHEIRACDTMNGNCTLIPRQIARKLGNLDPVFHHSFGDLDYGFKAGKAGFSVHVAPGFLGTCTDNPRVNTWRDRSASLKVRWRHLNSAKGSPFPEWSRYCRRHLGPLWPLYAVSPYLKTLFTGILHF